MILTHEICKDLVYEKLGITTTTATTAQVKNDTIAIFKSWLEFPTDLYFVAIHSYNPHMGGKNNYILTRSKLQLYKLPKDILDNWEQVKIEEDNKGRIIFNLSDAILVWHEDLGVVSQNTSTPDNALEIVEEFTITEQLGLKDKEGDNLLCDKLTMRDYACIHLKVPESGKPWLNQLIQKSLKLTI